MAFSFQPIHLAYPYSNLKQSNDDLNKKNQSDLDEINKLLLLVGKCSINLGALKIALNKKLENNASILRSISIPFMVTTEYKTIECNPEKYVFLNNHNRQIDPLSPRNPTRINNIIEKYNTTITLYKTRSELAKSIYQKALSSDMQEQKPESILDIFFNNKTIPSNELINFVSISEQLFIMLDQTIEELEIFSFGIPKIGEKYFKPIGFKKIAIYSTSMKTDENKSIFEKFPPVDLNSELHIIYKRYYELKNNFLTIKYPSIIIKRATPLTGRHYVPPFN